MLVSLCSINATNGSLLILEAVGIDRGSYSCDLSNTFGSNTRFNITLKVIGESVHVCVCVCVHVCVNMCMCVHVCVHDTCGCMCMHVCVCVCVNVTREGIWLSRTLQVHFSMPSPSSFAAERAPAPSTLRIIDGTRDRDLSLEWEYVNLDTLPEYRLPEHFIVEARLDDNSEYEMVWNGTD